MDTLPTQLDRLKQEIRQLGELAEQAVARAIEALVRHEPMLAKAVIDADQTLDLHEIKVEERCLAILAGYHPVENDLRLVVAVLKINNDLERVGDLAVNIADTVLHLVDNERFQRVGGCDKMAVKAQAMLQDSLQAFMDHDATLARKVIQRDDDVDDWQRRIQRRIEQAIDRSPEHVTPLMQLDFVIRQIERVGDMATNIAEDVIYLVEGKIVRHTWHSQQRGRPDARRRL